MRLNEGYDVDRLPEKRQQRRDYRGQGNKRYIDNSQVQRFWNLSGGDVSGIEPLDQYDTRVLTQFPVDLAVSHINSINFSSAVLEQTIGKTTGRHTDIGADHVGWIDLKALQPSLKFQAAAGDKWELFL